MEQLTGWGRGPAVPANLVRAWDEDSVAEALGRAGDDGVIARGCGSSYGDAALRRGGTVLDLRGLDGIRFMGDGIVEVGAGVTLAALASAAQKSGCTVPVLPGTGQVTVGGAIAADVHGKNHVNAGSFGRHVLWLDLMTADGKVERLSPVATPERFWATVAGMGLTGIILRAGLQLRTIPSQRALRRQQRGKDLEGVLGLMSEVAEIQTYEKDLQAVAWIQGTGRRLGRGIVETVRLRRGLEQHPIPEPGPAARLGGLRLPGKGLMSASAIRAANEVRWQTAGRGRRWNVIGLDRALHPLDRLAAWPALFGRRGLLQYQCLVPLGKEDVLESILRRFRALSPALISLKRLGAADPAPLSFPMPGWALALDFPVAQKGLREALPEVDERVLAADGRVYLAKDSRLDAGTFTAMYPRLGEWRRVRDQMDPVGVFASDLSIRLGLTV